VIILKNKAGYMPGVIAGLLLGAALFLAVAQLTANF